MINQFIIKLHPYEGTYHFMFVVKISVQLITLKTSLIILNLCSHPNLFFITLIQGNNQH